MHGTVWTSLPRRKDQGLHYTRSPHPVRYESNACERKTAQFARKQRRVEKDGLDPRKREAQVQSGVSLGLSAALYGEITFAKGAAEQRIFHNYPVRGQVAGGRRPVRFPRR